jgi:hypothetical protein
MLIFPDRLNISKLWIFGGRGGDNQGRGTQQYFNDTLSLPLHSPPTSSSWTVTPSPWRPRSGHSAVYEPPSISNAFTKRVYVLSGQTIGGTVLDDVWIWRPDIDEDGYWVRDYTANASYSVGLRETLEFKTNPPTGTHYAHSSLS